ncbi:hypothetical protein R1sor_018645 [Riccia sorocarpa]|uniref:Reverse transcriptase domain-containing protein n=1 Tax=Riccia sorocarpa TaxID=122646 RepID=A0ABD3IAD3_9MARC
MTWSTTAPTLLRLAEQGLQNSRLPPHFTAGDIVLLPKDGDQTLLQNKRPITLLNAGYKIVAKLLQNRMAPVMQTIVPWEQNAFLQGRNLHATVFLCNQAVWEAKSSGMDSVLLKVDFRKAYDSLSWNILFKAMDRMGFGQKFINCIKALTSTAASAIIINKTRSKPLDIGRAGHFADETHLMLKAEPLNLLNAKEAISTFGRASGLQVQWSKSLATWISQTTRPPWTDQLNWRWTQNQEEHKMLGFIFTVAIDQDTIFRRCL